MNTFIQKIFGKSELKQNHKEFFLHIMKFAKDLEKQNPSALFDLIRVLIKPLQSDLLISAIENELHRSAKSFKCFDFFMPDSNLELQVTTNQPQYNKDDFLIHLNKDPILPVPWHRDRYIDSLKLIGKDKILGEWKQDKINHYAYIWQPWGIVFVEGGHHSIATGIIGGEGTLIPQSVYDMSSLLEEVKCDGENYISIKTNEILAPVTDFRIGAIFEVGRLIKKHNILPMHI